MHAAAEYYMLSWQQFWLSTAAAAASKGSKHQVLAVHSSRWTSKAPIVLESPTHVV
jgi:hypothetical protein